MIKNILKFLIFISCFSISYAEEKIVFIDIDYVLNNSNLGKLIYNDLEKINKNNINILNSKEEIIKQKKDNLEKTKNISSKEKLENDIKLFNLEVEKYKKEKNQLIQNFKKNKKKKLDNFLIQINPLIQEYMKKNSINLVLEKNQIFIGNTNNDITNDIIELINKNLKKNG